MHRILGRCQSLGYNRDLPFDSGVALHADSPEWLKATAQKGIGCRRCNQTGCKRRIGVYEIFVVDNELRRMIHGNASEGQLMRSARQSGMATLLDDAIAKVEAGFTTCEEVLRVFGPQNALEIPCEGCGANLEERFHFCPFCGQVVTPQFVSCGSLISDGWHFCPNCRTPASPPSS